MDKNRKKKLAWIAMDAAIALILILLDQWTKKLVVAKLKGNAAYVLIKDVFEFDYVENRGSAFGMFQNQKVFLLLVGVLFLGLMIYLVVKTPAQRRFLPIHLIASCIVAGGAGNMIDRFVLGYVVDFFSFVLIHYPVFNVADVYIVVATITMAIFLIFIYKEEELSFLWKKKKAEEN